MANVAGNVLVGKPAATGGVYYADTGTTVPTDATSSLAGGFTSTGYISEDGVVQSIGADTTQIKAWGGDIVRTVQTSHDVTYQFTMIETTDASLAAYYGEDNVSPGAFVIKSGDLPHKVWDLEIADGDASVRLVIPNGQITERGDITYKDDTSIAYPVTLTAYPDSSGNKVYGYSDGVPAGSATSAPTVTSATPATAGTAGGDLITIRGTNFTGATSVKFGGTNATHYQVISDNVISAVAPAKTAGAQPIVVANSTGNSNSLAFTYA